MKFAKKADYRWNLVRVILLLIFCFLSSNAFSIDKKELPENTFNSKGNYLDSAINIGKHCQLPQFEDEEINIYQILDFALCSNVWNKNSLPISDIKISNSEISKSSPLSSEEKESAIIQQSNFVRNHELSTKNRDLTIGLLFDFYKNNLRKNIDYITLIKANKDYYLQKYVYDIIWLYCNFSFFHQDLEIKIESEKFYQTIYQITKRKYQRGQSSIKDLSKAKNSYFLSIVDRKNAEKSLAISEKSFLKILNIEKLPWQKNKKIQPPFVTMGKNWITNADGWILEDSWSQNRPELKILNTKIKLSYLEIKTIKASYLPDIFLYASSKYDKSRNLIDQKIDEIGLKISLFLPNKNIDDYNIQKSRREMKLANEKKQLLIDKFNHQKNQQYQDFKIIQNDINNDDRLLNRTLKNRNNALINYKKNHIVISKILDLEKQYQQTQRQNNILKYQQFTAWAFVFLGL
jgi:outer membrane protein TolC